MVYVFRLYSSSLNICQDELKEFDVYKNQKHQHTYKKLGKTESNSKFKANKIQKANKKSYNFERELFWSYWEGIFTTQSTLQNLYIIIINRSVKYVTHSKVVARWSPGNKLPQKISENWPKNTSNLFRKTFLEKLQAFIENLLTVGSAYIRNFLWETECMMMCILLIHLPMWRK